MILQFEASSLTDSLPSVTDEGGLQDIENFGIFKGLNGTCILYSLSMTVGTVGGCCNHRVKYIFYLESIHQFEQQKILRPSNGRLASLTNMAALWYCLKRLARFL